MGVTISKVENEEIQKLKNEIKRLKSIINQLEMDCFELELNQLNIEIKSNFNKDFKNHIS